MRCNELVDQGLQGLGVDRLVVVCDVAVARVHPVGGGARCQDVGSASQLALDVRARERSNFVAHHGAVGLVALACPVEPEDKRHLRERLLLLPEGSGVGAAGIDGGKIGREEAVVHIEASKDARAGEVPASEVGADVTLICIEDKPCERSRPRRARSDGLGLRDAEAAGADPGAQDAAVHALREPDLRQLERYMGA